MLACQICGNSEGNRSFTVQEMMFGTRDQFEYVACGGCGALQIATVPPDLSRYYPADYYAFGLRQEGWVKRTLKRLRGLHALGQQSLLGRLLVARFGVPPGVAWVQPAGLALDEAILDVGSGGGEALLALHNLGFSNLTGIDPYVERDVALAAGVRILKKSLEDVADASFDFIMLNHSFEHMPDPLQALRQVRRVLRPGKMALLRIPVADSYAWRTYGADWVQLDAPRHLFLHTRKSLALLAEQAGFEVVHSVCDSSAFQFWGSEQYRRGIPLHDPRSFSVASNKAPFTRAEIRAFAAKADELNRADDGDQACFYLRRS